MTNNEKTLPSSVVALNRNLLMSLNHPLSIRLYQYAELTMQSCKNTTLGGSRIFSKEELLKMANLTNADDVDAKLLQTLNDVSAELEQHDLRMTFKNNDDVHIEISFSYSLQAD